MITLLVISIKSGVKQLADQQQVTCWKDGEMWFVNGLENMKDWRKNFSYGFQMLV